jgi:microcystin-dependent protein
MYIGQIIMFGGNYSIRDFAFCEGQIMQITQNQALYSILGTTYGGNGTSTYGLPDLRGRAPVHQGAAPWGQQFFLGQQVGSPQITLGEHHLPTHTHMVSYDDSGGSGGGGKITVSSQNAAASTPDSTNNMLASNAEAGPSPAKIYGPVDTSHSAHEIEGGPVGGFDVTKFSMAPAGGGNPFDPSAPRLAISFLMSLQGTYPTRN